MNKVSSGGKAPTGGGGRSPGRSLRLWVVANDAPLPANSGGRVDVWRRLQALQQAGAQLMLHAWLDRGRGQHPGPAHLAQLRQVCNEVHFASITRSPNEIAQRMLRLARLPSHAASRWVTVDRAAWLERAQQFAPDAIWLDGLYGGAVAMWLSRRLGVPLVYRSHNIEHRYMQAQLAHAVGLKSKLGLLANVIGLQRFEQRVMRHARIVFDISQDDQAWWQQRGFGHVEWLPTTVDGDFAQALATPTVADIDVLYFGNLRTPNNVDAARWLVRDVLPLLGRRDLRVVLAGSDPCDEICALARVDRRVEIVANPSEMAPWVRRARVLINPVRAGSGVNLKSVEMLFTAAHLVSTSTGVQGLPSEARNCFALADDAAGLARAIDAGLRAAPDAACLAQRRLARAPYAAESMATAVLNRLHTIIERRP